MKYHTVDHACRGRMYPKSVPSFSIRRFSGRWWKLASGHTHRISEHVVPQYYDRRSRNSCSSQKKGMYQIGGRKDGWIKRVISRTSRCGDRPYCLKTRSPESRAQIDKAVEDTDLEEGNIFTVIEGEGNDIPNLDAEEKAIEVYVPESIAEYLYFDIKETVELFRKRNYRENHLRCQQKLPTASFSHPRYSGRTYYSVQVHLTGIYDKNNVETSHDSASPIPMLEVIKIRINVWVPEVRVCFEEPDIACTSFSDRPM